MKTPICDFVKNYGEGKSARLHMPGHKGAPLLGFEHLDITEIAGADSLYDAQGIIAESEANASSLFGAHTFYSTEGSSLCIRAMMYMCVKYAREQEKKPLVFAGRNAHKTFLSAVALLDMDVKWLSPERNESYLSCAITGEDVEKALAQAKTLPVAVYVTSPDYTGNLCDVRSIAEVCHKYGVLLVVDNAHGAYLKFTSPSMHPLDMGADMCCDSAHKTLPCLTGTAYLHVSKNAPDTLSGEAKNALAMFGSTSPSYLLLQSLDAVNAYLADGYAQKLSRVSGLVSDIKNRLVDYGYRLTGNEPLKISILSKSIGYEGVELARLLQSQDLVCEFADSDVCVVMLSPSNSDGELQRLEQALLSVPKETAIETTCPSYSPATSAMSVREAMLSPAEELDVDKCNGKILASPSVSCPPAVPILVCGEVIDENAIERFKYYGIKKCRVVK